jgi:hypothetical protein
MRAAMWLRCLLVAPVLAATVFVAAVPGATAASTAGYGATFRQWVGAHVPNQSHCVVGPCYGPLVDSRTLEPAFSFVQVKRGRVVGYDEVLRRGTHLLEAELQVAEQMPADVSLPSKVTVIPHDRYGHSCAVLNLYSSSLAARFGPKGPAGQGNSIGVELATVGRNGGAVYEPNAIDLVIVVPEYLDASTNC